MGFETIVTNEGFGKIHDGHGGYWERGSTTELIALDTAGSGATTTLSETDLLVADSIIEAVTARITSTFVDAAEWSLGDENQTDRFSDPNNTLTAGTVVVGLNHMDGAAGSPLIGVRQSVAGKVAITTTSQPSSGTVRVTVYYSRFVAPTE